MITVSRAPGWKCERCRKVLPEVGLCPEYRDMCMRCVGVVSELDGQPVEIDIHAWAAARFDTFLAEEQAAGFPLTDAVIRAGRRNRGEAPEQPQRT